MDWEAFYKNHGERLFYGGLSLLFCFMFIGIACIDFPVKEAGADWIGAAKTIMIGLAMLCYNKTRSPKEAPKSVPEP